MTHGIHLRVLTLLAALATAAQSAASEEPETRRQTFTDVFLYARPNGGVWLGAPMVSLGMIGVAGSPAYRLSAPLAQELQPLLSELKEKRASPEIWFWGLPRAAREDAALVLVTLAAEWRPSRAERGAGLRGDSSEHEILSAQLIHVEFIPGDWRAAWDRLDAGLKEVVADSRTAPGEQKKQRLRRAIEQSSQALRDMGQIKLSAGSRERAARAAPQARVVRVFQRRIEAEWGGRLADFVSRLGLTPQTPLPAPRKSYPLKQWLAAANSPAEFIAKVKQSAPEDTLEEWLMSAMERWPGQATVARPMFAWQVESLSAEQFRALRAQAQEELARAEKERQTARPPAASESDEETTIEPWGAVLRSASDDLLAEKGLLQGTLVSRLLPNAADVGLRAGDVIIDYGSVYDVVMGWRIFSRKHRFTNLARFGGKIDVLRNDRVLTLTIEKQGP